MKKEKYEQSQLLKSAVEDRDIDTIITCLINVLKYDLILEEDNFKLAWKSIPRKIRKEIKKRNCKLDGEVRIKNQKEWTEEYFFLNLQWLRRNFNMKRVKHIRKVGKYLSENEVEGEGSAR